MSLIHAKPLRIITMLTIFLGIDIAIISMFGPFSVMINLLWCAIIGIQFYAACASSDAVIDDVINMPKIGNMLNVFRSEEDILKRQVKQELQDKYKQTEIAKNMILAKVVDGNIGTECANERLTFLDTYFEKECSIITKKLNTSLLEAPDTNEDFLITPDAEPASYAELTSEFQIITDER